MTKKYTSLIIAGILAVAFTAIILIIPFEKSAISWMGYAFELVAIAAQLLFIKVAFKDNTIELKSKLYGYPIFRIGYIYLGVQTVVSVICLIAGAFLEDGELWWLVAVIEILVVAAAAIGLIATVETREIVERTEFAVVVDTVFIDGLKIEMTTLNSLCAGKPCGSAVEKLYEQVRYSDPVSVPELKAVEDGVYNAVMQLKSLVAEGNDDSIIQQCNTVSIMMADRNNRVKTLKR